MIKHFNMGNVWGRVAAIKAEESVKDTPYLSIQVECPNNLYGNVKTYGRLWGQDKIDAFMDYHKKHPGTAYRFRGFFSQYDKEEGLRFSNFTFSTWEVFEGLEFRAAFILVGEVRAKSSIDGDGKLEIHLMREGQGSFRATEEDFEVYTLKPEDLDNISTGDMVHIKGLLRYKETEDYFGSTPSKGVIRPYAMEITIKS